MSYIDIMHQLQKLPLQKRRNQDTGLMEISGGVIFKENRAYNDIEFGLYGNGFQYQIEMEQDVRMALQDNLYGDLYQELRDITNTLKIYSISVKGNLDLKRSIERLNVLIDQLEPKGSDPTPQSPVSGLHTSAPGGCTS